MSDSPFAGLDQPFTTAVAALSDPAAIVARAYEDLLGYDSADDMTNADERMGYWVERLDHDLTVDELASTMVASVREGRGNAVPEDDHDANNAVADALEGLLADDPAADAAAVADAAADARADVIAPGDDGDEPPPEDDDPPPDDDPDEPGEVIGPPPPTLLPPRPVPDDPEDEPEPDFRIAPAESEGAAEQWAVSSDEDIEAIAVDGDRVYAGRDDGDVIALSAADGERSTVNGEDWLFDDHDAGSIFALLHDGDALYSGGGDETVRKINTETGEAVEVDGTPWQFDEHEAQVRDLALGDDYLFSAGEDDGDGNHGTIRAIDPETGDAATVNGDDWVFDDDDETDDDLFAVTEADGTVYAGDDDGSIYSIPADDPDGGANIGEEIHGKDYGVRDLAVQEGILYSVGLDETLQATDTDSEEAVQSRGSDWIYEDYGDDIHALAILGDTVYIGGDEDGRVEAIDATTGEPVEDSGGDAWVYQADDQEDVRALAVHGDTLYGGTDGSDGAIWAVGDLPSGRFADTVVDRGETAIFSAWIENDGDAGSRDITLQVGDDTVAEKSLELDPDDRELVTFGVDTGEHGLDPGSHDVTLDTGDATATATLEVRSVVKTEDQGFDTTDGSNIVDGTTTGAHDDTIFITDAGHLEGANYVLNGDAGENTLRPGEEADFDFATQAEGSTFDNVDILDLGASAEQTHTFTIDQHEVLVSATGGEDNTLRVEYAGDEDTVTGLDGFDGTYEVDPAPNNTTDDMRFRFDETDAGRGVDLERAGDNGTVTIELDDGDYDGDWSEFEDDDLLDASAGGDIAEVSDGEDLGGITKIDFADTDEDVDLTLTPDQHDAVLDGEGFSGTNGEGSVSLTFTETADEVTGAEAIDTYHLADGGGGNDFTTADSAQSVHAGDGGDTITFGDEDDTVHLGDGDDTLEFPEDLDDATGDDGNDIREFNAGEGDDEIDLSAATGAGTELKDLDDGDPTGSADFFDVARGDGSLGEDDYDDENVIRLIGDAEDDLDDEDRQVDSFSDGIGNTEIQGLPKEENFLAVYETEGADSHDGNVHIGYVESDGSGEIDGDTEFNEILTLAGVTLPDLKEDDFDFG